MPELPEVETIKRGLQRYLKGHRIEFVEVKLKRIFFGEPRVIKGAKIVNIRRFGKGLVVDLDNGFSIAIHIKMTGQLIYRDKDIPNTNNGKARIEVPNKWSHVIFYLDKGAKLYYNDIRQFGWIKVIPTKEISKLRFFKELGPEPFNGLTSQKFIDILSKSKLAVKPLIMDQKKIGGIGNIYANDGLYLAGIDPRRRANTLTNVEKLKLYNSLLTVLEKGIAYGGASESTYVNVLGEPGEYQNHSLVYGKKGKPCKKGGIIKKIILGGRGTFFCPACQK